MRLSQEIQFQRGILLHKSVTCKSKVFSLHAGGCSPTFHLVVFVASVVIMVSSKYLNLQCFGKGLFLNVYPVVIVVSVVLRFPR